MTGRLLIAALVTVLPGLAHAADYPCPAYLNGIKLLIWKMVGSRGQIEIGNTPGGNGLYTWTSADRNARIVCGYWHSSAVAEIPVATALRQCENPQMSTAFHCR